MFESSLGPDSKICGGAKYVENDTRSRMSPNSGPKRLRELLKQPGIIRSLGAHDVFSALIVEQAGFETVFIGGFGNSASMLGLPDLNFLTMSEMADAVRRVAARVCIPVIADGDTGYGDLHNVQRTVDAFEAAGGERDFTRGPSDAQALWPFCQQTGHSERGNGVKDQSGCEGQERSGLRHFRPHRRTPDERPGRCHRSSQSMLRQRR